ncbi:hypothetical protein Aple_026620 [Acrocarpospora pleiomorpha]|uniref:Glutathionylspermidine synthase pre-ATP-grasp-like domain-containing protein n=1 Tax=Acrocarpospora pleiomorpha TaxID=90975 RepID=A0A5M3XGH8_9ACTN|nr:hypothetical protein [Acrocarpospora pleiomorpha]GES19766.1 hypothetical protein Aple_026620 [Acrocarpospora pleiomorpha]
MDPERTLGHCSASALAATLGLDQAWHQVQERVAAESLMDLAVHGRGHNPFPVRPALAVLHPDAEPVLRRRVQGLVECLNQLVRQYPADRELQDFLAIPARLHRWIMMEPAPEQLRVDYCRLDLLGSTLDTVRVLEFNPSSPGGVISSGMVNRFWRTSKLGPALAEWAPHAAPFESEDWFARWLLRFGREHVGDQGRIALFHSHESTKFELDQVHRQLARCGREVVEIEPCDIDSIEDVRLGYLKYIPLEPDEVRRWDHFCARLIEGTLVVPNPLGQRWVAENKLCLAALSDPRFRRLFGERNVDCLDALVPYSRKLGDGIEGDEVVSRREHLVLKAPYSFHGKDVFIGSEYDARSWARVVGEHEGWLVQERVRAASVETHDGPYLHDVVVPVLEGKVIGYSARMNDGLLLNGAQGGGAYAIFSPHALN